MKLFPEEQKVLDELLQEWYNTMREFVKQADGIFSDRAKKLDRTEAAWESINFPAGYVHEMRKRVRRVEQHMFSYQDAPEEVDWDEALEELRDILNYDRMLGALILMLKKREGQFPTADPRARRLPTDPKARVR